MADLDDIIVDERKTRKFLRLVCCLRYTQGKNSISTFNLLYIISVYTLLLIVVVQGVVLAYSTDDIVQKVESIHYVLTIIIVISYMSNELYNNSNLDQAWKLINLAYNEFSKDRDENRQIHVEINVSSVKTNKLFCFLMSSSCVGYLLFAPMRQLFTEEDSSARKLPVPLYMPFDTSDNFGFSLGMAWEAISLFYICGVSTSIHQSFRGIMGRLRGELKLLNNSIKGIHVRAEKYQGKVDDTEKLEAHFQFLVYKCLREDIVHHQMLLEYYSLTKIYLGTILLLFIFLSSIILGAVGFLITKPNSNTEDIIKFLAIVTAELFFVYQLCWEGERVAEESGQIFNNLFNIPWNAYDRNVKGCIRIMLCGTIKPIRLKTSIFNVEASLETYNWKRYLSETVVTTKAFSVT
ncbi:odorant receptor 13a-like isoform X2 [Halyomorpha halys]|uniref:odorant receptor 13a-like isoform X2 n=1 Tax=Halyomorpha halys TaxID=286706 RepID=UPI0034D29320